MYGHLQLCDKDDGHTIRSAISQNPTLYINFMALFYRTKLRLIRALHQKNRDLETFCSCDLDHAQMTFI